MSTDWRTKGVRIVVTSGPYEGQRGRIVKGMDKPSEWMVKLEDRFAGTILTAKQFRRLDFGEE